MVPGFVLRLSWIFLLFGIGACFPNFRYDHKTSGETSNLDDYSQLGYQSPPSYVPTTFSLAYETESDSDSSDPEDDTPWVWRHTAYVNPEKTNVFPEKSQQESYTRTPGSEEFRSWYDPTNPGVYAGATGTGVYTGAAAHGVYSGRPGVTSPSVYAGGAGPGVYAAETGGAGSGAYAGRASGMGSGVYSGGVGSDVYAGKFSGRGAYPHEVVGPTSGGMESGAHATRPSSAGSDYGYSSQSAGTTEELSAQAGNLMTADQLPFEAWNAKHVPEQLIAQPPVHPSSLVIQSHGAFERARDFRTDMKYNQDTFGYIPLPEMQEERLLKTGSKGPKRY